MLPIGGADMPVVISLLNAFTGLSAAATGIALNNTALIVAGMLVGASGTILTHADGGGHEPLDPRASSPAASAATATAAGGGRGADGGTVRSTSAADVAIQLAYARQVVVVPGLRHGGRPGPARRARDGQGCSRRSGVEVKYAIHPVAGRMPGHMNVLLAEADVPYDQLKEMDDINPEFGAHRRRRSSSAPTTSRTPTRARSPTRRSTACRSSTSTSAASVIVLKRSMNSGFAGIDNPLFYNDRRRRCCSATPRVRCSRITEELKAL